MGTSPKLPIPISPCVPTGLLNLLLSLQAKAWEVARDKSRGGWGCSFHAPHFYIFIVGSRGIGNVSHKGITDILKPFELKNVPNRIINLLKEVARDKSRRGWGCSFHAPHFYIFIVSSRGIGIVFHKGIIDILKPLEYINVQQKYEIIERSMLLFQKLY